MKTPANAVSKNESVSGTEYIFEKENIPISPRVSITSPTKSLHCGLRHQKAMRSSGTKLGLEDASIRAWRDASMYCYIMLL